MKIAIPVLQASVLRVVLAPVVAALVLVTVVSAAVSVAARCSPPAAVQSPIKIK